MKSKDTAGEVGVLKERETEEMNKVLKEIGQSFST